MTGLTSPSRIWLSGVCLLLLALCQACATGQKASAEDARVWQSGEGAERSYLLDLPDTAGPAPTLIVLHGGGSNARQIRTAFGLSSDARARGIVMVYPQGLGNNWNDGRSSRFLEIQTGGADDVAFLSGVMSELSGSGISDPSRIYLIGVSNGGMMAMRLACEKSETLAGVLTVIAGMPTDLAERCSPSASVPVVLIAGSSDPIMPWDGGRVAPGAPQDRGTVLSAADTAAFWIRANRCTGEVDTTVLPDTVPSDNTRAVRSFWIDCAANTSVQAITIQGGGHTIPGRPYPEGSPVAKITGAASMDIDIADLIWSMAATGSAD